MTNENFDLDSDLQIDPLALDVECLRQAALAVRYARYAEALNAKVRLLEEKKKTTRSELIVRANANPVELVGKEKPNAADIEAFYRTSEVYKNVVEELNETLEQAALAEVARWEIAQTRKRMIELLVTLHGQNYYATPNLPRDLAAQLAEQQETRTNAGIAAAINKKRKRTK